LQTLGSNTFNIYHLCFSHLITRLYSVWRIMYTVLVEFALISWYLGIGILALLINKYSWNLTVHFHSVFCTEEWVYSPPWLNCQIHNLDPILLTTPLWLLEPPSILSLQSDCSRRKLQISNLFSKTWIYSTYMQWVDFLLFSSNYCHSLCHIPILWYFGLVLFLSFTHCIPVVQHSSLSCKTTEDATKICWF